MQQTVEGEPLEIYPFLGSSRLEEPIGRYPVSLVFHGHAHRGQLEGRTKADVPVYNVSMPLLTRCFPTVPRSGSSRSRYRIERETVPRDSHMETCNTAVSSKIRRRRSTSTRSAAEDSEIPFLIGGAFAYRALLRHRSRRPRTSTSFCGATDVRRALTLFRQAGYRTEVPFPHWLGKIHYGDHFMDVIFSSGNGVARGRQPVVRARGRRRGARRSGLLARRRR